MADEELMLEIAKDKAWRLPYLRTNQRQWDGGDAYNAWQKIQGKKGRSTNEYFGEDLEIIAILVIYHTGKRK